MSDMFDELMNKPSEEPPAEEKKEADFVPFQELFPPAPAEITDEEVKTATPAWVTPASEPPTVEEQKKDCLDKLGQILRDYDGKESDVPLDHQYWDILALYRKLNANP